MSPLGERGDGYELAVQLENSAIWKEWLGAGPYALLLPHLSSPAAWHSFMSSSSTDLQLQMSVRALLFDRVASSCCFNDDNNDCEPISSRISFSSLPQSYLQLDASEVYFPLDQDAEDWTRLRAMGSPLLSNLLVKHGLALSSSSGKGDDVQVVKGATVKPTTQASQHLSNLTSPKQEVSRPSMTKVKKVEAWENFDAKRPMEVVGSVSKKLRSPKISSKPSFQGDPTLNLGARDHLPDKMSNTKSPPGSLSILEEPKYSAIGAGRVGHVENADNDRLWYDRYSDKHLTVRMDQVAQRYVQQKIPFREKDACLRTTEGMAGYLDQFSNRCRKLGAAKSNAEISARLSNYSTQKFSSGEMNKSTDQSGWMPEFKFLSNCVPDNCVPAKRRNLNKNQMEYRGFWDKLETPAGYSDLGIGGRQINICNERAISHLDHKSSFRSEGNAFSGSPKAAPCSNTLQQEEANQIMQKTVAKIVAESGFDGLQQSSMDVLCDLLGQHFRKLGSGLRIFLDNYRRHCSQAELLRMFMQSTGNGVEDLMEHVQARFEVGSQIGTPLGLQSSPQASQLSPQASNQKKRAIQEPSQQLGPQQPPNPLGPLQQTQHSVTEKPLKRRQPSNLGRAKKIEKHVGSGRDSRPDIHTPRVIKPIHGSPHLHPQQSQWHPQINQPQQSSGLQNFNQQISSLRQPPSRQQ